MSMTKLNEIIDKLSKIEDGAKVLRTRAFEIRRKLCEKNGHRWPKYSGDYYYCEDCNEYLG